MVKKTTAEQATKWCKKSTSSIYEWKQRYAKSGYVRLIPGSRRPKRVRQSSLTEETVQAFIKLRTSPEGRGLGGRKLAVMLQRAGHQISCSQGDRLVSRLLADRKIVPARHWGTKRVKRKQGVHVKPQQPQQPGDLVKKKSTCSGPFWESPTLEELARLQNVQPIQDISDLYGTWPGEIDDGFEEAIDRLRHGHSP